MIRRSCLAKGGALALGLASGLALSAPAAAKGAPSAGDPLEGYYGNTMICAAGQTGNDLCHIWLERDGTMVNIDPGGIHKGRYTRGPRRRDGKVPVCLYYDTPNLVLPAQVMAPPPGAPPPPPLPKGGVACSIKDFRSDCRIHESVEGLDPATAAKVRMTIAERFHAGMCYPLPPRRPGESWYEDDDPMPSQNGIDKVFLVEGHR